MRRTTHLLIGGLAFLAYTFMQDLLLDIPVRTVLMGFIISLLGSIMPDVLEPARHWNHRGICHSRRAMKFAAMGFVLTAGPGLLQAFYPALSLSFVLSSFFLGYALHLLADSTTPAGIQW